jgi:vacuolar protein sorting-associated protein 8
MVNDALRQLPPLNGYSTFSPLTADTQRSGREGDTSAGLNASASCSPSHPLSHADTSYALGADDEELLLQELLNITAGAMPFVSSKSSSTAVGEPATASVANSTPTATSVRATSPTGAASTPQATSLSPSVALRDQKSTSSAAHHKSTLPVSLPASTGQKAVENVLPSAAAHTDSTAPTMSVENNNKTEQKSTLFTSHDEQDILDAILAAVDGQQSSVSGDITDLSNDPKAAPAVNQGATHTSPAHQQQQQQSVEEEESDAVDRVLEEAKLLASSTVLCETQRGELALHIHEHVALRRHITELNKTIGKPTCVAAAEAAAATATVATTMSSRGKDAPLSPASVRGGASSATSSHALAVAVGTNLGAIALFDHRWRLLGLCGSVEANVVNARGAVVSLALSSSALVKDIHEEPTAASGHARGVFILWSLHSYSPLRVIKDECTVPLLRVQHLHRDPTRVLVLESSGAVKLFQFWRVMSKHMLRSTTVTAASATTPISDMDTLPFPSSFYLRHLLRLKENLPGAAGAGGDPRLHNHDNGIAWLLAPTPLPPATAAAAGVSRTAWATVPDKHLVAAVSNDALLVYVVEGGLQGAVTDVARHTHPPSSALSNELVRFVPMEQDGAPPRVLICVSWNTEVELLLLTLQLPETTPDTVGTAANENSVQPLAQGVERVALLRLTAPLLQMVPLAGSSMLLLDQNNDAQLMDASVAVMVERHHFAALEYVTFSSRVCGIKYNGTVSSNQTAALLLGKEHVYSISVYSWRERLSKLVARRKFVEALDLAKGFAEDVALSMVGLSSNAAQRRLELHQYMEHILLTYLESSLSNMNNSSTGGGGDTAAASPSSQTPASPVTSGGGNRESLLDVLQHVAAYCSTVDALDLLYGSVARTLQQRGLLSHLLYVLERTMRHGVVTHMPEPLIERFIALFLDENELMAVEVALGVRSHPNRLRADAGDSVGPPSRNAVTAAADDGLSGRERAELALMYLDTGLPSLLRLAQEYRLLRLSVTIMSYRQKQYVEALAYALDVEEEQDQEAIKGKSSITSGAATTTSASVAVDLVEYTLKDSALLPATDIPASEQRPAKKALLEFLLQTDKQGQHNLLRFLRRKPQYAVRVLLFALSDEGLCSPWESSADGFCRTQFVSSVFFLLTGGTRTQPRLSNTGSDDPFFGEQRHRRSGAKPLNLFLCSDEELSRHPGLRKLCAAELAQRSFPPYDAVHTFLSNAALFDELFLTDVGAQVSADHQERGSSPLKWRTDSPSPFSAATPGEETVRLDVWVGLVIQDCLFMFQSAETAEQRRALQEQLIDVMAPPFIAAQRITAFQPDFKRLRMARCLAALLCKEQRYTEAIRCYFDPVQNRIDPSLQHDVFAMLRSEMQRLQDLRTHTANEAARQQVSGVPRLDSDVFGDDDGSSGGGGDRLDPSPSSDGLAADGSSRAVQLSQQVCNPSFTQPPPFSSTVVAANASASATGSIDSAIKALQRGVMSQVEALVRIDATALAQFIFDYLPSNHREVMRLLRGSSVAFLDYLDELMAQGDPIAANDINLQNTYIELLCAHAPARVFPHLQEKGSSITYDVQLALRAVRKHRIADASIYLLEKTMMIEEAMTVMLNATRAALADVREEVIAQAAADVATQKAGLAVTPAINTKKDGLQTSFAPTPATSASANLGVTGTTAVVNEAVSTATVAAAPLQSDEASRGKALGGSSKLLPGVSAVQTAPELMRLISIGKALCERYHADRTSGINSSGGGGGGGGAVDGGPGSLRSQSPEYWFRLLDVFMVPRRLLCDVVTQDEHMQAANHGGSGGMSSKEEEEENGATIAGGTGMQSELEVATRWVARGWSSSPHAGRDSRPTALSPLPDAEGYRLPRLTRPLAPSQRRVIAALVSVYTQCTSDVLRAMMSSLDLAVVVDKVVQDNKDEAFRPFKPIILDMMSSLSFELEASRLCESATESDVMSLGRELYQQLNTGIVTLSDCCALCHLHLSEPPPSSTIEATNPASVPGAALPASSSSSAVCVYTCGHAYHTLCCLHAVGPASSSPKHGGCFVCVSQRFPPGQSGGGSGGGGISAGSWRGGYGAANGSNGQRTAATAAAAGGSAGATTAVDAARMQRRIRQTKVKIDHAEDLYPLLKTYLTWGDSTPSTPAKNTAAAGTRDGGAAVSATAADVGSWVLAPSPRVPAAVGELATSTPSAAEGKDFHIETLTDAEILELFGSL